jgi:transcriptional regulator of acetoin/glycerol metabolism
MPTMIDTKLAATVSLNGRLRNLARTGFDMGLSLDDLEYAWRRELLIVALVESKLNCEHAAHLMGVHRNTITRMMREAGIRINRQHHVLEEVCFDF